MHQEHLPSPTPPVQHLHLSARLEDRIRAAAVRFLRSRGWTPRIEPYVGYGTEGSVRVLARVLLSRPHRRADLVWNRRGWRNYLTVSAPGEVVRASVTRTGASGVDERLVVDLVADRDGYVDGMLDVALEPGWHDVQLATASGAVATSRVFVVGPGRRLGVISDIDDTVMITMVPSLLRAVWNTFGLHASERRPVPGMADLYHGIASVHPEAPFVYLSNGAWNTAGNLERFLDRNGFPPGTLLLTDWGPTATGWFRSGQEHKGNAIDRLVRELPDVGWLLLGDDGQHDPEIYAAAARRHPEHVAAIGIRQLSPTQRLLAHEPPAPSGRNGAASRGGTGTPGSRRTRRPAHGVPTAGGPDGAALARALGRALR
ncbi:App1 family protein [Oerskovia enterophila]|uniref:App1 family protein n=1 Tax=Oerskovia enterophila TaxID=43678 RepID=UPI0037F5640D